MRQKLSGYQACKLFMNIRNHFAKENFDVFTSNGIRYTEESYEKRPDKRFFETLAHEYASGDLGYYFMSNLQAGAKHPSEMMDITYREYKAKMHKIERLLETDCALIQSYMLQQNLKFNDFFVSTTGGLPIAIQMLNGKLINIESVCLINEVFDGFIIDRMDKQITDRFVWDGIRLNILKYSPWLKRYFKVDEIKQILKTYI